MTLSLNLKTFALFFSFFLLFQQSVLAQEATLSNIIVTNTRDDLLVYLTVEGAFREKMKEAILSGVPTTFSFLITLHRVRNLWKDKKISDITVSHTVKYNNLKKEFAVKRSWENGKPLVTQSFEEAQKRMAEIDGLKVVSLNKLDKGQRYQLGAMAELNKLTLPFYLHHVLFFVSLWDFETDWYTIDFIY
jgi:hypothetical protein